MLTTGANDGRVNPMQSRKFAAALEEATSSGLPVYLGINSNGGHGKGSSRDERIGQTADWLAFLFDQLSMKYPIDSGEPNDLPSATQRELKANSLR